MRRGSRDRDHCATRTAAAAKALHDAEHAALAAGRAARINAGSHGPDPLQPRARTGRSAQLAESDKDKG
jgi:hypothetical protein